MALLDTAVRNVVWSVSWSGPCLLQKDLEEDVWGTADGGDEAVEEGFVCVDWVGYLSKCARSVLMVAGDGVVVFRDDKHSYGM